MPLKSPTLRYHCVSIHAGPQGCAAVKALQHTRILSAEAPHLPLPTCETPATCRCTYRHHDDRRKGPRRSSERNGPSDRWTAPERRRSIGRRATD
jgi:hypothetical protein